MPSPKGSRNNHKKPSSSGVGKSRDSPARPPQAKKKKQKAPPPMEEDFDDDADIVMRVARMMKSNKLSQVQVGQEARVSQAVISQWLARKYVSTPAVCSRCFPACVVAHGARSGAQPSHPLRLAPRRAGRGCS